MMQFNHVVIFVTVGTHEEADIIADILLEQQKVACVNIVPAVDSRFRWEGRPERDYYKDCIKKLVDEGYLDLEGNFENESGVVILNQRAKHYLDTFS